jgi:cytochrome P450
VSVIEDILDRREASGEKMSDTVNALLEIRQGAENKEEFKAAGITVDSVYGQAYEFFAASYAGIITTLNYLCYYLATNVEAMRCVREEVDSVLKKYDGNTPHEALGELRYLSGAIQETLRISPAFFRPERQCTKDWDSGKGYKIKKGTRIIIPVYAVHHNPQVYPEPEKFKPERFLAENKDKLIPCTFLPFGQGQRQCMGMKLVIEILKSFMVRIVRDFEIKTNEDTVWKEHPGIHFILKLDPIYLDFILRKGQ